MKKTLQTNIVMSNPYDTTGWSKKRTPSFIFEITSVIQHRF